MPYHASSAAITPAKAQETDFPPSAASPTHLLVLSLNSFHREIPPSRSCSPLALAARFRPPRRCPSPSTCEGSRTGTPWAWAGDTRGPAGKNTKERWERWQSVSERARFPPLQHPHNPMPPSKLLHVLQQCASNKFFHAGAAMNDLINLPHTPHQVPH